MLCETAVMDPKQFHPPFLPPFDPRASGHNHRHLQRRSEGLSSLGPQRLKQTVPREHHAKQTALRPQSHLFQRRTLSRLAPSLAFAVLSKLRSGPADQTVTGVGTSKTTFPLGSTFLTSPFRPRPAFCRSSDTAGSR